MVDLIGSRVWWRLAKRDCIGMTLETFGIVETIKARAYYKDSRSLVRALCTRETIGAREMG